MSISILALVHLESVDVTHCDVVHWLPGHLHHHVEGAGITVGVEGNVVEWRYRTCKYQINRTFFSYIADLDYP